MTLNEALDPSTTISRAQAYKEIKQHGADWFAFLTELGRRERYSTREILFWLGY